MLQRQSTLWRVDRVLICQLVFVSRFKEKEIDRIVKTDACLKQLLCVMEHKYCCQMLHLLSLMLRVLVNTCIQIYC